MPNRKDSVAVKTKTPKPTKEVILEAALHMACTEGLDGLTIGELAKTVGMSKSGLFAHFQGKDNLQLMVLQKATDQFVDAVMRTAFKEKKGRPRIEAFFKHWLEHLDDPDSLPGGRILISASIELDDRPGILRDYIQKVQRDLIGNLEKAAKIAVEAGHFKNDLDISQFAWTLYSFVLGYHHFKRMLEDPKAEVYVKRAFKELLEVSAS